MNSAERKEKERELQYLEKELAKRGTTIPQVNKAVRQTNVFMSYLRELLPACQRYK